MKETRNLALKLSTESNKCNRLTWRHAVSSTAVGTAFFIAFAAGIILAIDKTWTNATVDRTTTRFFVGYKFELDNNEIITDLRSNKY
jgi:ABC-type nitrate/sulfonate/bicarbonate transport system permease component